MVSSGQSISRAHFGSRCDLPLQVKVLKEERPSGLLPGQFSGIFDVREVFVVGDDGDRMGSSLKVLMPLLQSQDNHKKFAVIHRCCSCIVCVISHTIDQVNSGSTVHF